MKTKIIFLVFLALLFQINSVEAQKKRPLPKPKVLSARQIAEKVLPSVVLIITQDEDGNPISQGSGFVYKPGLVVSNLHVFERASNAVVKNVKTGEISKAVEVVGMNARQDICVIRIDNTKFPVIPIGDSRQIKTGDDIYVASNPKGLEGSFTKGIVSSVRERERANKDDDEILIWAKNFTGSTDRTLFQIDAAISPGSSGGALVEANGRVIGIVKSSIISGQNLNFAIPIEQVEALEKKFSHPILLAGACAFPDREKRGIGGLVRSVKQTWSSFDFLTGKKKEEFVDWVAEFDVYGNETLLKRFYRNFSNGQTDVDFDENGLRVFIKFHDAKGAVSELNLTVSQSIADKLEFRHFSSTEGEIETESGQKTYDSNGRLVRIMRKSPVYEGETIEEINRYDQRGWLAEKSIGAKRGENPTRYKYNYTLDSRGNWLTQTEYEFLPELGKWRKSMVLSREIIYHEK